jgi:hypothetical protein
MARARGGGRFIVSALGAIALLVFGLGITSWFTTANGIDPELVGSMRPSTVELCRTGECISAWTYEVTGSPFATVAFMTLCVGVAFSLAFAWAVYRGLSHAAAGRVVRWLGYGLGVAVIAMTIVCLFVVPPEVLSYDVADDAFSGQINERILSLYTAAELGFGGFLAIAGVLVGMVAIHEARPHEVEDETEEQLAEPERPPRVELMVPPRGVETDPFRAPPQPPPIAVVRHGRPPTAPIVADPSEPRPKLLR